MPEPGVTHKSFRVAAVLLIAAALLLALFGAQGAEAQCALCKSAVNESGESAARAMNLGILVLLVPPVTIFCLIFAVAFKRGKKGEGDD